MTWIAPAASALGGILSFAGNIMGTSSAESAQQKALKKAEQQREAATRSAISTYLQPEIDAAGPADLNLSGRMVSNPATLTPTQQQNLADLNRNTRANLAASGNLGSGQAGQAVLDDATQRQMASDFDENQQRSDSAADLLASRGASASGAAASDIAGVGNSDANNTLSTGNTIADEEGQLPIANANLIGQTLGAIGAFANKRDPSKYTAGDTSSADDFG